MYQKLIKKPIKYLKISEFKQHPTNEILFQFELNILFDEAHQLPVLYFIIRDTCKILNLNSFLASFKIIEFNQYKEEILNQNDFFNEFVPKNIEIEKDVLINSKQV